jgi:hypothetical protein
MSEIIEDSLWKYRISSFPYLTFTVIYVDDYVVRYKATNPLFNQSILERDKHSWFERFEPIIIGNK